MSGRLIGPGSGCPECGEYYGRHSDGCGEENRVRLEREAEDRELGKLFLRALKEKNALSIGAMLRKDWK